MTLYAGSRYLKCDRCEAVLDRRPEGDNTDGGVWKRPDQIYAYARSIGWNHPNVSGSLTINQDLCPKCSGAQPPRSVRTDLQP